MSFCRIMEKYNDKMEMARCIMKKNVLLIAATVFCLVGVTACSSKENTDTMQSEEVSVEATTETEQEVKTDSLVVEEEKGLTAEAQKMIEELGGTVEGKVLVTYFDYPDRIIYNTFVMTDDSNAEFLTHVFYYTKEAYVNELNNEKHYGEITESNDDTRYTCTLIETIENTDSL